MTDEIAKPSIVVVIRGLAPHAEIPRETGGWAAMHCPFHGDRNSSASINPDTQRFRCHGCGIAGDGYDVIQEVERCDFLTARSRCAEICGQHFTAIEPTVHHRSKLTARHSAARAKLIRKQRRK